MKTLSKTDRAWIDGYFVGLESQNVQPLHTSIDPESKKFIKWTFQHLSDPNNFTLLSLLIEKQVANFLKGNRKKLLNSLAKKLKKGALEHGEPTYSQEEVIRELQQEFLDLIGWNMVLLWNKWKEGKC